MTNKHEVGKIKCFKTLNSESLETVHTHTHTHTLYVYQIDKEKKNIIKNRRKNLYYKNRNV